MKSLVVGAGAGISAALMTALSKLGTSGVVRETRQRMRSRSGVSRFNWPATVPSSRKTRNPADPAQAYLIARAEAKRARRAEKLIRDMRHSYQNNYSHCSDANYFAAAVGRFNPFHIAQ